MSSQSTMSTKSNSRTTRSDGAIWMIYGANGYTGRAFGKPQPEVFDPAFRG